jgi:excisionase family DNA binding protein
VNTRKRHTYDHNHPEPDTIRRMPRQRPPQPPSDSNDEHGGDVPRPQQIGDPGDIMTVPEVADLFRFSEEHIRNLAEEGTLPGWKMGSSWRFSRIQLLDRLAHGGTCGSSDPQ